MKRKGFTLIELLAVIVILGVVFLFITPKLVTLIKRGKMTRSQIIEEKIINAAKEYASNYDSTIYKGLVNVGDSKTISMSQLLRYGLIDESELNELENFERVKCTLIENDKLNCELLYKQSNECEFAGTLTQGTEFVDGEYTYRYKQQSTGSSWENIVTDGWGVMLTDKVSTEPVTTEICTSINGKPIVSTQYMFYNSKATEIDLSSFDTSNVVNMYGMFYKSSAESLDLSSFDTRKVTSIGSMFEESQAETIDLSSFDTRNVTNISYAFEASKVKSIDISGFDTSKVTSMKGMFLNSSATEIIGLTSLNTSNVTDMDSMFEKSNASVLDLSHFDTSKVTTMEYMFLKSKAHTINLSGFNTSNVTNMSSMFVEAEALSLDLSSFNTSKVTTMNSMFEKAKAETLNLSNFNTSNVTDMAWMFFNSKATEIDVTSFDTSKVTTMNGMFEATNTHILDLSSFNTSSVTNKLEMFYNCKATIGYARTQADANTFNSGTSKPAGLTFIVNSSQDEPEPAYTYLYSENPITRSIQGKEIGNITYNVFLRYPGNVTTYNNSTADRAVCFRTLSASTSATCFKWNDYSNTINTANTAFLNGCSTASSTTTCTLTVRSVTYTCKFTTDGSVECNYSMGRYCQITSAGVASCGDNDSITPITPITPGGDVVA